MNLFMPNTSKCIHLISFALSSGNMSVDAQLFVFTLSGDEEPHQLIAYTQHRSPNHHWVCQLDLVAGSYTLVPYTTGCCLKPRETGPVAPQPVPLTDEEDGRIRLTQACMWETGYCDQALFHSLHPPTVRLEKITPQLDYTAFAIQY